MKFKDISNASEDQLHDIVTEALVGLNLIALSKGCWREAAFALLMNNLGEYDNNFRSEGDRDDTIAFLHRACDRFDTLMENKQ